MGPRLCENEAKELRSPACSRLTKCNFFTLFHTTWGPPFRDSLYIRISKLFTLDLYLSRIGAPLCSIFYTYLLVASSGTPAEERVPASAGESSVDPEMNRGMLDQLLITFSMES